MFCLCAHIIRNFFSLALSHSTFPQSAINLDFFSSRTLTKLVSKQHTKMGKEWISISQWNSHSIVSWLANVHYVEKSKVLNIPPSLLTSPPPPHVRFAVFHWVWEHFFFGEWKTTKAEMKTWIFPYVHVDLINNTRYHLGGLFFFIASAVWFLWFSAETSGSAFFGGKFIAGWLKIKNAKSYCEFRN